MSRRLINLARAPFVNSRPLQRVVALLWSAGVVLLVVNVALYWNYRSGSVKERGRLQDLQEATRAEDEAIERLEQELTSLDLTVQNQQIDFLNQRISERTFPWGELFERLVEAQPPRVRLRSLSPRVVKRRRRSRSGAPDQPPGDRVYLRISGVSGSPEAHIDFIDSLFKHPSFDDPDIDYEAREKNGDIRFDLNVMYFPGTLPVSGPRPAAMESSSE